MSLLATKFRTALALGLPNLVRVANFRLGVSFGWNRVRRLRAVLPRGPFYQASAIAKVGLPLPQSWWSNAMYFGRWPVAVGDKPPQWHTNPLTGQHIRSPLRPWWQIPDFDPTVGDIKSVWEASRFDWVLAYAQCAALGDERALGRLNLWLEDWCEKNPAYLGANWKCGQEASIRVMHLAMAALLLEQPPNACRNLHLLVKAHLARIECTLGYAMAQDNNHGTSEAAALFIGGSWMAAAVSDDLLAARYEAAGRDWLEDRVTRLFLPDGSFSQYSLTYHRLALDTLSMVETWRRHLQRPPFSDVFYSRARAAVDWMKAFIDPDSGDGPNLGANDGARLFQLGESEYRDFRPCVQLAMALFYGRVSYPAGMLTDAPLKWLGLNVADAVAQARNSICFNDGGYALLRQKGTFAVMRYPRFRFRPGQADALHVDLWRDGENLLRDAGSYGYSVERKWLDYFSGTEGHNTIQFDERDQMPRLGRFLFGDWLRTREVIGPETRERVECFKASYRDRNGALHSRLVALSEHSLRVEDQIAGSFKKAVLRWRLNPGPWKVFGCSAQCGEHKIVIATDMPIKQFSLIEGWESRFYLEKTQVPVIEIELDRPGTIITEYFWKK